MLAFKTAVEGALPATVRDLVEHEYAAMRESHLYFAYLDRPQEQVM